jgi:hypothetical protein
MAAVLAASVACAMTVSSASFAAIPSGESLIAVDPLPGFTVDASAKLRGPIDGGTLLELTGVDPGKVPDAVRDIKGQARTWRAADGSVAIAMVLVGDDELAASVMLRTAVNASKKSTDESFDTGLMGTIGFSVKQSDVHISSVIWRQSNYLVEVLAAGDLADTSVTNAKLLATSQAAVLTSLIGVEPTLADPPSAPSSEDYNVGYRLGQLTGIALLVGLVVYLIRRGQTRRAEDKNRLATVSAARAQLPATSEGAAWAGVPTPTAAAASSAWAPPSLPSSPPPMA